MGSIGQVSCGKTVGKWPRKANTQTGNERFHVISPIFTGKTMREFRFDLSLPPSPPLSLSLYLWISFDLNGRKKGEEERKEKFRRNRKHVLECSSLPYVDSSRSMMRPWYHRGDGNLSKNHSDGSQSHHRAEKKLAL